MRIIGLTGGTGSGKGIVSRILEKKGAFIIDTDSIAHDIILKGKPAYCELVEYFGKEILNQYDEIERQKLGSIVFADGKEKLEFLNNCTHKYIYLEIEKMLEVCRGKGAKAAVIDAPLLLEGRFRNLCEEIWVVYASEEIRLKRIMDRDNISEEHAKNRIASQRTWENYKKHAHVIIVNDTDVTTVEEQIEKFFEI